VKLGREEKERRKLLSFWNRAGEILNKLGIAAYYAKTPVSETAIEALHDIAQRSVGLRAFLFCVLQLLCAPLARGQIPTDRELPFAIDWPKEIPRSTHLDAAGWGSDGLVVVKRPTPAEQYVELEPSEPGKSRTAIRLHLKRQTPLPSCGIVFKWRTNRVPKEIEIVAKLTAPQGKETSTGRAHVTPIQSIEKKLHVAPSKEWTTVEVPFQVGEKGLPSFDQTYTIEIAFIGTNAKVMLDELKLIPLSKK
jgi:hypothetical protein